MSAIQGIGNQYTKVEGDQQEIDVRVKEYAFLMQAVKGFHMHHKYDCLVKLLREKVMPLSQSLGGDYLKQAEELLLGAYDKKGKSLCKKEDYAKAVNAFEAILEYANGKYPREACAALINKSIALHHLEKYPEVKIMLEEAKNLLEKISDQSERLNLEELIEERYGLFYYRLAQYQKSIECHAKALAIFPGLKEEDKAKLKGNLGLSFQELRQYDKAMKCFENDKTTCKKLGLKQESIEASINIGNYYLWESTQSSFEEAEKIFSDILEKSELAPKTSQKAKNGLANAFLCQRKYDKALPHYEALVKRKNLNSRQKGEFNYNLGEIYLGLDEFVKAEDVLRQSILGFAELQSSLTNAEWQITIFEKQRHASILLEKILVRSQKTIKALEVASSKSSRALGMNLLKRRANFQRASLELSSDEIQQIAFQQNATLIVYSLSTICNKELAVWIIPPEDEIQHQLLPAELLFEDIENFEELLEKIPFERKKEKEAAIPSLRGFSIKGEEPDSPARRAARKRFIKQKLAKWYEAFVAPVERYLPKDPNQTVTIVPDGFLAQLPFAAFQGKDGKFLIEKHPISIAPSIKALQLLDEIRSQRKLSPPEETLIIGNPSVPNMDPLLIGQNESEDIGQLLHVDKENILIQEKATVPQVLEKAPKARHIFIACHGEADCRPEFDPYSVFEGQLKLAPDGERSNGNLHSQQISSLDLNAELVFLSACYSGTGKVQQEGTIGNVWSFLAAGALSTIATYWPLPETETTRHMVNRFFHHLLGAKGFSKLNKAQALQQAMLLGIKESRDRFDQWGVFYLSGLN